MADSHYTFLLSETLLTRHTFQLDDAFRPPLKPEQYPGVNATGLPYQVQRVDGHVYSIYPPGSALLATPWMALMKLFGRTIYTADGGYNPRAERRMQIVLATFLMALTGVIWYFTARRLLSSGWSLALSLAFALGTSIWSLQSRALWAETWGALLLALLVGRLVATFALHQPLHPVWCATLVSWLFFLRPPYAAAALALIGLLAFARRWRDLMVCTLAGAAWLAGFITWSLIVFNQPLPSYFSIASVLVPVQIPAGMAGLLVSPGRGLLLFSPFLLAVLAGLFRHPCAPALRPLRGAALAGILLHLLVFAAFPVWWGGHCFGPRYAAAIIPWFFLLGLITLRTLCDANPRRPFTSVGGTALGLLLAASILIHGYGAISGDPMIWNLQPRNVDAAPARLWEWRQPQFLAGWLTPSLPAEFPPLQAGQKLALDEPGTIAQLWDGWSDVEDGARWAMAPRARVIFTVTGQGPLRLHVQLRPYLRPGKLEMQRLRATLNGQPLGEWRLVDGGKMVDIEMVLPAAALRMRNTVQFEFPDARSPKSLHHTQDPRRLAVAVKSMTLLPGQSDR